MADFGSLYMTFGAKLDSAGFGEVSNALKQISNEASNLNNSQDQIASGAVNLGNVYRTLVSGAAIVFLRSAAMESRNAAQESFSLQQRVQGLGLSWEQNEKPLNKYLDTLEELTRFEKGDATTALNILIDKTRDLGVSQRLLVDVMGLSVATGMDLNSAATMVADAQVSMGKGAMQLGKALGINRWEIKSNTQVLEELHMRYGEVAIAGDKMVDPINRAGDAFKNFKERVGDDIKPITDWLANTFTYVITNLGFAFSRMAMNVHIAIDALSAYYQAASQFSRGHIGAALDIINQERKNYAEQVKMMDDITAKRDEFNQHWKDGTNSVLEIEAEAGEKRRTMAADTFNALASIAQQSADVIGQATVKGLQGDVKAWRNAAAQIIDITIRQAQAVVMARAIEGAAAEVASKGVVGIATGMAAIAWGAAQVAVLAGLGQALKGLTGTESAGGAAGGGVGTASPTTSASAAAAQPQLLQVVINGDYVSDTQFAQDLAKRISGMVENRDLRLISSATVTNG